MLISKNITEIAVKKSKVALFCQRNSMFCVEDDLNNVFTTIIMF